MIVVIGGGFVKESFERFLKKYSMVCMLVGSLQFRDSELTSVMNDSCIITTEACKLLRKLSEQYVGLPILVVMDNARYLALQGSGRTSKATWHQLDFSSELFAELELD
jgi:hypothetical protein